VENKEIYIGDRIVLKIFSGNVSEYDMDFPEVPEDVGDFSFISSEPFKQGFGKKTVEGRKYIVTIYETGTRVIPPVHVRYKQKKETEWQMIDSPQVPLEVLTMLAEDDKDIRDIKALILFGRARRRILIGLLFAVFILGLVWFVLWRKKRKEKKSAQTEKKRFAHEIAYEELERLKSMELSAKGLIKEYYIRLSDILRHYLENRFSIRSPEMTTEEFMEFIKKSPKLINEHKGLLKDFLVHCDMVKFAKYGPTQLEMIDSFKAVKGLVDQTREREEEGAEDAASG
ncbi:MAG: hypothetical protein ABH869_08145, partial [Candidatus Omnitrophota bacterium]